MKPSRFPGARFVFPAMFVVVAVVLIVAVMREAKDDPLRKLQPPVNAGKTGTDENAPATIVGAETCSRCHKAQAQGLAASGHSRTFTHTSRSEAARSLVGQTFSDPERGYTYRYHFDPQAGLSVSIPGKIDKQFPLHYALGSGNHAVTFLGLVPNRKADGSLETIGIEHRVSLFPHAKNRLAITPGQAGRKADQEITEFGAVEDSSRLQGCVGCHTTSGRVAETTIFDLRENVSCENCHGPGSRHVAAAERHETNPGGLKFPPDPATAAAELQVCGSCHRLPSMLEHNGERGIHRGDSQITRFQPVGLMQSPCFLKSDPQLRCTTCHDPHQPVSHDLQYYTAQCLKCHSIDKPTLPLCPVSPKADCLRCHMPGIRSVHEVFFTDHWIRVRDERDPQPREPIPVPKRKRN